MPEHGTALTVGQYAEFGAAVLKALPRDIASTRALAWARNGVALEKALRRALVPQVFSFPIVVDGNKTIEQMVEAGHYAKWSIFISSEYFPLEPDRSGVFVAHIIKPGRGISSKEVIAEIDMMGFRPADLRALLAFGEQHSAIQELFRVVALGSTWRDSTFSLHVPTLSNKEGEGRTLDLVGLNDDWFAEDGFLTVPK